MIPAEIRRPRSTTQPLLFVSSAFANRTTLGESVVNTDHGRGLHHILLLAAVCLMPFLAWSQNPFPESEVRDTVVLVCSQCHPLTRIIDGDMTAEEWEFTLYDMIARGAPVHAEDIERVRQYLIDNFATDD